MTTRLVLIVVMAVACGAHAQTQPSTRRYQRGAGAYDRAAPQPQGRVPFDPLAHERAQLIVPGVEIVGAPMRIGRPWIANEDFTSVAWVEAGGDAMRVNFNGTREPVFHEVKVEGLRGLLSADGAALAYVGIKADGQQVVVFREKESTAYNRIEPESVRVSRDGRHVGFVAIRRGESGGPVVVVDDKQFGPYWSVTGFCWSPDSSHFAYAATDAQPLKPGSGFDIFIDGQHHKADFRWAADRFAKQDSIVWSPDSKRWAARGQVFAPDGGGIGGIGGFAVIVDGKMQATYPDVVRDTLCFSPDSKEAVYAAGAGPTGDYYLVREGKPGRPWNFIASGSIHFGNAGKSVAMMVYTGKREGRFRAENSIEGAGDWSPGVPAVVVDDKLVAESSTLIAMSPTSETTLRVALKMDNPFNGPITASLTDGAATIPLPDNVQVMYPRFSPDGTQWAAVLQGNSGGTWLAASSDARLREFPAYLVNMWYGQDGALMGVAIPQTTLWRLRIMPAQLKAATVRQ